MIHQKNVFRLLLDRPSNPLSMARPKNQSLQYQHIQRALKQGSTVVRIGLGKASDTSMRQLGSDVNRSDSEPVDFSGGQAFVMPSRADLITR